MLKLASMAIAAAALFVSGPVAAATFTLDATLPAPAGAVPTADATSGTVSQNVTDSVSGVRRSPWEGTSEDGALYTSVSGGAAATYEFASLQSALTLLWGSVDTYNDIDFYAGGSLVDTINGAALISAGAPNGLSFIVATIVTDFAFDSIVIRSGSNAFEFANLSTTAVPLPGAALLLLSGIGGFAFSSRRKQATA